MDKILIAGKTGIFSEEALRYIAGSYQVLLTGRKAGNRGENLPESVRIFPAGPKNSDFARVFELGKIRAVWYVTGFADGGRGSDESEKLDTIRRLCARSGVERLIVITESTDPTDYRSLLLERGVNGDGNVRRGEQLSSGRAAGADEDPEERPVAAAVVRLPLLTGTDTGRGRLDRIFLAMEQKREILLSSSGVPKISLLPVMKLSAMLLRMTSETWFHPGIYAADGAEGTLEGLREILQTLRPDAVLTLEGTVSPQEKRAFAAKGAARFRIPVTGAEVCDGQLGELYLFPTTANWHSEIAAQYNRTLEGTLTESTGRRLYKAATRHLGRLAVPILDLIVMFAVTEFLSRITSESVYFKIVDVRVLFVIFMGMMHGLVTGFAAAFLECVMLVIRYSEIGISGLLLFYNVENWIPFVYYLTAGIISGYNHQKNVQERRAVSAENALIRNKYLFLNEAYRTSVSERGSLRAQILSEEESYARLYGAVRSMNQRTPEAVFVEAVRVLRTLLENDTVYIYQMDSGGRKARVLSCCLENALRPQFDLSSCPEMMRTIREGKVWKNTRLLDNAPMYASMVRFSRSSQPEGDREKEVLLLVTVEQAEREQQNTWYMNHFTILCGLLQDALETASLRERMMS